jgi:hypothetical protein
MTTDLLDQVIEPIADCLTPESAARIVKVRADAATQARIDELAEKANEGLLTDDERADYDRLLAWFHMVTILQAQARRLLRQTAGP